MLTLFKERPGALVFFQLPLDMWVMTRRKRRAPMHQQLQRYGFSLSPDGSILRIFRWTFGRVPPLFCCLCWADVARLQRRSERARRIGKARSLRRVKGRRQRQLN